MLTLVMFAYKEIRKNAYKGARGMKMAKTSLQNRRRLPNQVLIGVNKCVNIYSNNLSNNQRFHYIY